MPAGLWKLVWPWRMKPSRCALILSVCCLLFLINVGLFMYEVDLSITDNLMQKIGNFKPDIQGLGAKDRERRAFFGGEARVPEQNIIDRVEPQGVGHRLMAVPTPNNQAPMQGEFVDVPKGDPMQENELGPAPDEDDKELQQGPLQELSASFYISQLQRKQRIQGICAMSGIGKPKYEERNLFVVEKHRFLACVVPQVDFSFWRKYLTSLNCNGKTKCNSTTKPYKALNEYTATQQRDILQNYYKVMFVREPMDRLWSAYNNKIVNQNPYFLKRYGVEMVKKFRKGASSLSKLCGHDATFSEFLRYVLHEYNVTSYRYINLNWKRYHEICDPCQISYDLIGTLETFNEDFEAFEKTLGITMTNFSAANYPATEMLESAGRSYLMWDVSKWGLAPQCNSPETYIPAHFRSLVNRGFIDMEYEQALKGFPEATMAHRKLESFNRYLTKYLFESYTKGKTDQSGLQTILEKKRRVMINSIVKLPEDLRKRILDLYKVDFALFGYNADFSEQNPKIAKYLNRL